MTSTDQNTPTKKLTRKEADAIRVQTAEALVPSVLPLALLGTPAGKIADQLGHPVSRIKMVMNLESYKKALDKAIGEDLEANLKTAKAGISALISKAISAVNRALECGNTSDEIAAAKMVFKAVGLEQTEAETKDTSIQIILPGASSPQTFEVKSEVLQDGRD